MSTLSHQAAGYGQVVALILILGAHRVVLGDRFCGVYNADTETIENNCWQPCETDGDCCSPVQRCDEAGSSCGSADLAGANHFFCGVSWCDAAYKCGAACPEQTECLDGEFCYGDIPCDSDSPQSAPPLPQPPTSSPYQFCGRSLSEAKEDCWQPCPRGDSDCCSGQSCHDTSSEQGGTCSDSDRSGSNHFFCGSSWCDAAYSCQYACPGGSNEECPINGQYCYADIPCNSDEDNPQPPDVKPPSSAFSQYCGTSAENAADNCWQPCRADDDCCAGTTCYSGVSECTYPDNIGADHFFCGSDFCDASYECSAPCPTGYDAECPTGYRCFANTPCNANIRSMSANMLDFGLPLNAAMMMRQYSPVEFEQHTKNIKTTEKAAEASSPVNTIAVGIFFGIAMFVLVGLNIVWHNIA